MSDFHIVQKESGSKDIAEVLKASEHSKRSLSAVEYHESKPHFELQPMHIALFVAVSSGVIGLAAGWWLAWYEALVVMFLFGMLFLLFLFVTAVNKLNSTKSYVIEFSDEQQQKQMAIRLEVQTAKNQLRYVDLPEFVTVDGLLSLAQHAHNRRGFKFNREHCSQAGICTQRQFNELKDSFIRGNLATQQGKQYSLTEGFFALADKVSA